MIRQSKPAGVTRAGMAWEVIEPGAQRFLPWVSINTDSGIVAVTQAAYELMGEPKAVLVLFSDEHTSIGLSPCDPGINASFYVTEQFSPLGRKNSTRIRSIKLARRLEAMGYQGSYRLPVHWDPSGVLWGDLTNLKRTSGRPRSDGKQDKQLTDARRKQDGKQGKQIATGKRTEASR